MDELRDQASRPKRRERPGDWVFAVMANTDPAEPRAHAVCKHCGDRLIFPLPVLVSVFVAMTRAYVKAHSQCPPPPKEKP
jgi:hypothetical protein